MGWSLPPLPDRTLLADLCREAAAVHGVQPQLVEKDFHLTRLLWALGTTLGDGLLLKGGTLLSKVDLGFYRMSEDADLVVPGNPDRRGSENARRIGPVREAVKRVASPLGARVRLPGGERFEHGAHVLWELEFASDFGRQVIRVEVSIRPVLLTSRRVALQSLLDDPLAGDHRAATCFALHADEARAEKVRAAFTREAIRDFYDLEMLRRSGLDFRSPSFTALVDEKLRELHAEPMSAQARSFGLDPSRRRKLEVSQRTELEPVLRQGAPRFDLSEMLETFDRMWNK